MRQRLALIAAMLVAPTSIASAQAVMTGVVRDSTGRVLHDVEILLEGTAWQARSDSAGRYVLNASAGSHVAVFRSLGYAPVRRPVTLSSRDTLRVDAILAAGNAQELAPVDVKGKRPRGVGLEGFGERRALGLGKFIDSTVLRQSEARRLSGMLREYGVRIAGCASRTRARNAECAFNPVNGCPMSVYLDGTIYYRTGSRGEEPPDLSREFMIMNLEAVEVYRGSAQIPMEFSGRGAECGVIVLWTRRGR
jgi:hypothetical protein